jgi:hypothetical protein
MINMICRELQITVFRFTYQSFKVDYVLRNLNAPFPPVGTSHDRGTDYNPEWRWFLPIVVASCCPLPPILTIIDCV